jgi:FKBP-type peptidyl-prolyl cis-trans isomerase
MARKRERIFALVMAGAFLVTTVGVSASVIWQIMQDNKDSKSITTNANTKKLEGTEMDNFTPVAKVDTLQIIDTKEGTGDAVKPGASITADYTGAVASTGIVFQSSFDRGEPVPFSLNGVIPGWSEGMVGMKVGGVRRLLIPAAKAYADHPPAGIPVNADLVFDVYLRSIDKP